MFTKTIGALAVSLALMSAPIAGADTFYVGGTNPTPQPSGPVDISWLGNGHSSATSIGYPASTFGIDSSVASGVDSLDVALQAPGPHEVVCVSQGCVVSARERERLNARSDITFVNVADPTNPYGIMGRNPGLHIPVLDVTFVGTVRGPYTTTVISRQYDGVADWPAQQGNLLAVANAIAGAFYLHPNYSGIDLSTITPTVDGNTAYYRVPTANLPLLQPLRDLGVHSSLVDAVQAVLKPMVDTGYETPSAVARPQAVTGHRGTPNPKRPSCARLAVCSR